MLQNHFKELRCTCVHQLFLKFPSILSVRCFIECWKGVSRITHTRSTDLLALLKRRPRDTDLRPGSTSAITGLLPGAAAQRHRARGHPQAAADRKTRQSRRRAHAQTQQHVFSVVKRSIVKRRQTFQVSRIQSGKPGWTHLKRSNRLLYFELLTLLCTADNTSGS